MAGNITTASTMSWALHYLSIYPDIQTKLREALRTFQNERPSWDELDGSQYLDAVTREIFRHYAAGTTLTRCVARKVTVPLSEAVKGRDGKWMDTVTLVKGTSIKLCKWPNLTRQWC